LGALAEAGRESNITFETPAALNVKHTKVNGVTEINLNLTLQEISRDNLVRMSGGTIQTEDIAGVLVSGATQTIAAGYTYNNFIKIQNQNYNLGDITIASVSQDPTGTPVALVLNTDYFKATDSEGNRGILIIDSTDADNSKSVLVTYSYTPKTISRSYVSETNTITPFMLRFKSTMSDGRTIDDYYPRVETTGGLETVDQNYDATEFKNMPWSGVAQLHDSFLYNSRKTVKVREQYTV
jgi:hypothetical protein